VTVKRYPTDIVDPSKAGPRGKRPGSRPGPEGRRGAGEAPGRRPDAPGGRRRPSARSGPARSRAHEVRRPTGARGARSPRSSGPTHRAPAPETTRAPTAGVADPLPVRATPRSPPSVRPGRDGRTNDVEEAAGGRPSGRVTYRRAGRPRVPGTRPPTGKNLPGPPPRPGTSARPSGGPRGPPGDGGRTTRDDPGPIREGGRAHARASAPGEGRPDSGRGRSPFDPRPPTYVLRSPSRIRARQSGESGDRRAAARG
jgi:hypothetical protein